MKIKSEDIVQIRPYLILLDQFVHSQIEAGDFEQKFLSMRRFDDYWMGGLFDERIGKLMDTFFLDVDAYAPTELLDRELGDIDANEFRFCADKTLEEINKLILDA